MIGREFFPRQTWCERREKLPWRSRRCRDGSDLVHANLPVHDLDPSNRGVNGLLHDGLDGLHRAKRVMAPD